MDTAGEREGGMNLDSNIGIFKLQVHNVYNIFYVCDSH